MSYSCTADLLGGVDKVTRIQSPSMGRVPSADAIVAAAAIRPPRRAAIQTVVTRRSTLPRAMRWPVFLCGFIAGISGGVALMKSPAAKKPAMQHVLKKAGGLAHSAYAFAR